MDLELNGSILTIRSEIFGECKQFKQEVIERVLTWLKDYFNQDVSSAHSIYELIDKWNECKPELELFFNLMALSIVL